MKTYTITTESTTIRTYEVKASSEKEAKKLFNNLEEEVKLLSEDEEGEEITEIEEN